MHSYDEALRQVLGSVPSPESREVAVSEAAGHVLAQAVVADADMPAFDRTAMDGYALRAADAAAPGARLRAVGEERPGGAPLGRPLASGECSAIYTGAPIPAGADAVVMVERTRREGDLVEIAVAVRKGENIRFRGEDVRRGERLLEPGVLLRPQELAVCASFGAPRPRVIPRPTVAVLSTGDELVAPGATPGPGQIRDSNGVMLAAQAAQAGAAVVSVEELPDVKETIRGAIDAASRRAGVLVLTGGVSMGAYDFVAPVLGELGFAGGFHKVRVKPGKPVWFGRRGDVLAFGLPGNPVSSFVTFEIFVRPAIEKLRGLAPGPAFRDGVVAGGPAKAGDREQFVPARVDDGGNVTFLAWSSSADFVELARADALARIPVGVAPVPGANVQWLRI